MSKFFFLRNTTVFSRDYSTQFLWLQKFGSWKMNNIIMKLSGLFKATLNE